MTQLADVVDGFIHADTQVNDDGTVDLTVKDIKIVERPGRIDFGGGELAPAGLESLPTTLRNETDEYGWWNLDAGTYLLEYNETLEGETPVFIQPRNAVTHRGAFHPTCYLTELSQMPFIVGSAGIHIKENARLSTLRLP